MVITKAGDQAQDPPSNPVPLLYLYKYIYYIKQLSGTHSRTWKELIEFNGDLRGMIQNYSKLLKMQKEDENDWFWDQGGTSL